ncbi:hypothetical protein H2201_004381 [Coniosporium apollinis]|uniref:BHLH domain-containing protein n=1 Tax=Coniosporium apollinis TaxID=61459 RepID=A0ABQ9NSW2_9PEZI|nr:hypothetical protein H2201_004381 [Coniosporium apollinis]
MASVGDDDFAKFLDLNNLDDIDLDFSTYSADNGSMESSRELNDLANSLDLQHLPSSGTLTPQVEFGLSGQAQQTGHPGNNMQESGNTIFDFGFQEPVGQYQEHNQYGMQYALSFQPQSVVPPTPNSVEMHADTARYLQQMDAQTRAILEQRHQLRKDDAEGAFTPLGTPAVTPHDTHFQIPRDFTVPGAYAFSPLTSPALEAQNQNMRAYYSSAGGSTSSLGTASLLDQDVDMLRDSAAPLIEPAPRSRTNNRASTVRSGPSTRIRQSPIAKPSRRKATLSSTVPPKEVSDLLEEVQRRKATSAQQHVSGLSVNHSLESSPAESISPEPLSEPLMGPPPKPSSVHPSPSILANGTRGPTTLSAPETQAPCPATPASLMRLPAQPAHVTSVPPSPSFLTAPTDTISMPMLEDLALPEAADPAPARPPLPRIDTAIPAPGGSDDTPRIPARKTPKLGANCTPMMSATSSSSAKPSPVIAAMSPSSARRVEPKGRGKKRGSVSGAGGGGGFGMGQGQSPALRPKISPVIKPLLPDGGHPTHPTHPTLSPDAHALLLASRSNYQNLIEGTAVPGVSYPETLATDLTAKRTSHKLAEQGRRNRINVALAEMAVLLPGSAISVSSPAAGQGSGEKGGEGAVSCKSPDGGAGREGKEGASKAATVEKAIEYIRTLQREAGARDRVIREREGEIAALRERLSLLESGSNGAEREKPEEVAATAGASEVMSDG